MKKKHLSVIIIPHLRGKQKNISLSRKGIRILQGVLAIAFVTLSIFLIDYFSMDITRSRYRVLEQETDQQKKQLAHYKNTIDQLNERIRNFEEYKQKIDIMAGLKFPEALKEVGVGSGPGGRPQTRPIYNPQEINMSQLTNISQRSKQLELELNNLMNFFQDQNLLLATTPSIYPAKGYQSSSYGHRPDPFTGKRVMHWGIDIATNIGNPIWATADGTVISTTSDKIGGKTIKINHGGLYVTVYCHLNKFLVRPGQKIKRGDVIGEIGRTGRAKGPHVHYEVRVNGKRVNPFYYILEQDY